MDMEGKDSIRVAVVGSGMAGLVAAYLLHQDARSRYAVTLFEQGDALSLDSASISIPSQGEGCDVRVDLPMRAFAGGFYKNLKAMYEYLGVKYHAQPFLFKFSKAVTFVTGSSQQTKWTSRFTHSSNNHRVPLMRPEATSVTDWIKEILYLLACYSWFSICCFFIPPEQADKERLCETVSEYLRRIRLPQYFITFYLLPMMCSVATCSHDALLGFPAADVTEYKRRTHGRQHYTASNGVQDVQNKLARGINTKLSSVVSAVEIQPSGVKIRWSPKNGRHVLMAGEEFFDKVILAVSPDVVGKIFQPLQNEMAQIPSASVESIIHTDTSSVNDRLDKPTARTGNSSLQSYPAQTIHMRTSTQRLHRTESIHIQPPGILVTTCPFTPIDQSQVIKSTTFTRVLRTPQSRRIINAIFCDGEYPVQRTNNKKSGSGWKNGNGNVWLVGSWCWDGMVLLEGCVESAMKVAEALDVQVPWATGA